MFTQEIEKFEIKRLETKKIKVYWVEMFQGLGK